MLAGVRVRELKWNIMELHSSGLSGVKRMTSREFVLRKVTMHHDSERNLCGKIRTSHSYLNSEYVRIIQPRPHSCLKIDFFPYINCTDNMMQVVKIFNF